MLDLQEKTSEILVTLDDLVEGLREGLHFLALVIAGLLETIGQLLLQVDGICSEVALIELLRLMHGGVLVGTALRSVRGLIHN